MNENVTGVNENVTGVNENVTGVNENVTGVNERRWRRLDSAHAVIVVTRFSDSSSRPCCGLDTVSTTFCPRGGT